MGQKDNRQWDVHYSMDKVSHSPVNQSERSLVDYLGMGYAPARNNQYYNPD